jgi:hypothetical protein
MVHTSIPNPGKSSIKRKGSVRFNEDYKVQRPTAILEVEQTEGSITRSLHEAETKVVGTGADSDPRVCDGPVSGAFEQKVAVVEDIRVDGSHRRSRRELLGVEFG